MKKITFLLLHLMIIGTIVAQSTVERQIAYGGTEDDGVLDLVFTLDGGLIFTGYTYSNDGDVSGNHGGSDVWVVKLDAERNIEWQRCYGGALNDEAIGIIQTNDSGYILAGSTSSSDGDVSANHGGYDFWVVKIDSIGTIEWQNCYGGTADDFATDIDVVGDDGYIVVGSTNSTDGDVTGNNGGENSWVLKIGLEGEIQWENCYGGTSAGTVQNTTDGGFIIGGSKSTGAIECGGSFYVIKTDANGEIIWDQCYGGDPINQMGAYVANAVRQTLDGGYIFIGTQPRNYGPGAQRSRAYVLKTDDMGQLDWEDRYYGAAYEYWAGKSVDIVSDTGYVFAVKRDDTQMGATCFYVCETDGHGNIISSITIRSPFSDEPFTIHHTGSGKCIVSGHTESYYYIFNNDHETIYNHGGYDAWLVDICLPDELSIDISDSTYCLTTTLTATPGFDSYLWNTGDTTQSIEVNDGGSYRVSVTDGDGCPNSCQVWISDPLPPGTNGDPIEISITDTVYCVTTTLEATAGFESYLWNNGMTTASIEIDAGGTYSVIGTNDEGCTSYDTIIAPDPLPVGAAGPVDITISDLFYCYTTTLSATEGFDSYSWSTGETSQSIEISAAGNYSVIVTNSEGCISVANTESPGPVEPFANEEICMITLDQESGHNAVVVNKTTNVGTDSILIYRMNNMNSLYDHIASLNINEISVYIDTTSIPMQQNYQYRISIRDTCGKESELSEVHRTILLQASVGVNDEVNLLWNPYEGFDYPNFEIYRSNENGPFNLIANVPNNNYTFVDLYPPAGENKYQVRVMRGTPCSPSKAYYTYAASNVVRPGFTSVEELSKLPFKIYPNPASQKLTIETNTVFLGNAFSISDQSGRIVLTGTIENEVTELDIKKMQTGLYTITIAGKNTQSFKIIKN